MEGEQVELDSAELWRRVLAAFPEHEEVLTTHVSETPVDRPTAYAYVPALVQVVLRPALGGYYGPANFAVVSRVVTFLLDLESRAKDQLVADALHFWGIADVGPSSHPAVLALPEATRAALDAARYEGRGQ